MADVDDSTFQAVNNANFKVAAEMGSYNALSHQNRLNIIAENFMIKALNNVHQLDIVQAQAVKQMQTGHAGADTAMNLAAAMSAMQGLAKTAALTPPTTA